jgi:hypothetical protein
MTGPASRVREVTPLLGGSARLAWPVIGLVGVELGWPMASLAVGGLHRRNVVDHGGQQQPIGMLAALIATASGRPLVSVTRGSLDPGLPQSTGLGPT